MDEWTERELALHQRHEEILQRRKALLEGRERYYNLGANEAASFIFDIHKAEARNEELRQELMASTQRLKVLHDSALADSDKLKLSLKNYGDYMRSVLPLWLKDVEQQQQQRERKARDRNQAPSAMFRAAAAAVAAVDPSRSERQRTPTPLSSMSAPRHDDVIAVDDSFSSSAVKQSSRRRRNANSVESTNRSDY